MGGKREAILAQSPSAGDNGPVSARRQLYSAGWFCSGDKGGLSQNCTWAADQPGFPGGKCPSANKPSPVPPAAWDEARQVARGVLARLSGDRSPLLSPLLRGKQAQGISEAEGRHLKRGKFIPSAGFFPFRGDKAVCAFTAPVYLYLLGNGIKAAPYLRCCIRTALTTPPSPVFNPVFLVLDGTSTPSALPVHSLELCLHKAWHSVLWSSSQQSAEQSGGDCPPVGWPYDPALEHLSPEFAWRSSRTMRGQLASLKSNAWFGRKLSERGSVLVPNMQVASELPLFSNHVMATQRVTPGEASFSQVSAAFSTTVVGT